MVRFVMAGFLGLLLVSVVWSQEQGKDLPKDKGFEVTTVPGPAGDLLRKWWKEKTASGNQGDWYENRDEAHSPLDVKPYPQLKVYTFTETERKNRENWAAARVVRNQVTFGNSSTSAPPTLGGSNPRQYYVAARGLQLLHDQYVGNNLYIYPEHLDHDPGHNGPGAGQAGGYGDLYPTNTPYLITSQGSSYTDQPFMKAIPLVLAAFRPEVKKKLIESGLLMPTIQWIFRSSNKHLKSRDDYLTGLAHPSVFEGAWVDELAMVQAAHDLKETEIPPLVKLKVMKETSYQSGRDFFDPVPGEKLGTTPCVIARVFRAGEQSRKMVVSAAETKDPNGKPLQFHWVLLRGDPERVVFHPTNTNQTEYEIEVKWQPRRPVLPGSLMESNRVDIGVIAHNGSHYTAPSFITWFFLDNEDRSYDEKGRITQWAHNLGSNRFDIQDWGKFIDYAVSPTGAQVLELNPSEITKVREFASKFRDKDEAVNVAKRSLTQATEMVKKIKADKNLKNDPSVKNMEAAVEKAQKATQVAELARNELLDGNAMNPPFRKLVFERLSRAVERRTLVNEIKRSAAWKKASDSMKESLDKRLGEYRSWGLKDPSEENPRSPFALSHMVYMHAQILNDLVFAGTIRPAYQIHFVDQRITTPQAWRDLYHWDDTLGLLGWTRFDGKTSKEFSHQGLLVIEKDNKGRCTLGRVVKYAQEPFSGRGPNNNPLVYKPTEDVLRIAYGPEDPPLGKVIERLKKPTSEGMDP